MSLLGIGGVSISSCIVIAIVSACAISTFTVIILFLFPLLILVLAPVVFITFTSTVTNTTALILPFLGAARLGRELCYTIPTRIFDSHTICDSRYFDFLTDLLTDLLLLMSLSVCVR